MEHDNISENTNELSFGKFEDESSSNRSSRMSTKVSQPLDHGGRGGGRKTLGSRGGKEGEHLEGI